jgi:hypothetical protein
MIRSTTAPGDAIVLAGFGNQYVYVMADRVCATRFVMPLLENGGYSADYRRELTADFDAHPPAYLLFNRNNYRGLDTASFYTQFVQAQLPRYGLVMENDLFEVWRRSALISIP